MYGARNYSRGQTKTTNFLNHFGMSDKCSDYILKHQNSTLGTQWTDPYEPIFEKCPFEKLLWYYDRLFGHSSHQTMNRTDLVLVTGHFEGRIGWHFILKRKVSPIFFSPLRGGHLLQNYIPSLIFIYSLVLMTRTVKVRFSSAPIVATWLVLTDAYMTFDPCASNTWVASWSTRSTFLDSVIQAMREMKIYVQTGSGCWIIGIYAFWATISEKSCTGWEVVEEARGLVPDAMSTTAQWTLVVDLLLAEQFCCYVTQSPRFRTPLSSVRGRHTSQWLNSWSKYHSIPQKYWTHPQCLPKIMKKSAIDAFFKAEIDGALSKKFNEMWLWKKLNKNNHF